MDVAETGCRAGRPVWEHTVIELTWVFVDKTRLLMILSSISVVDGCCDDSRMRIVSRFGTPGHSIATTVIVRYKC